MWLKIGYFPSEYDAWFSEAASFLENKGCDVWVDWEVSVNGAEHYVIVANVDKKDLEEVEKMCSMTVLVATPVSEPEHDPAIEYVIDLLKIALYYVEKGNKDEARKRIARAIRALKNCSGLADKIRAFEKASEENPWLKGDLFLWEVDDAEELIEKLRTGCWSVGVAFVWKDFCFAEQCSGCGEFAVFKYSNGRAFQFESITATWMSEEELREFLDRITKATDEQLMKLEY